MTRYGGDHLNRPLPIIAIFVLALTVTSPGYSEGTGGIVLSPSSWDFGVLNQDDTVETFVSIENRTDSMVSVDLILACGCLSVEPSHLQIPSRGTATFRLVLDSAGEKGAIVRTLLIRTDSPALESAQFLVRGTVRGGGKVAVRPGTGEGTDASASKERIILTYYYSPGCGSCERFLADEIPRLERELGVEIEVRRRDVFAPGVFEEYEQAASSFGVEEPRAFPVLLVGNTTLLQGEEEISSKLEPTLRGILPLASTSGLSTPAEAPEATASFKVLPVLVGGLLDGINPCAFTTLIFLLSALALAGRGRREVLTIGSLFSLAVFLTYFAVGLGLFSALRAASSFPLVSRVIRWVLIGVLVIFAALSARDAILAHRGRATEMTLQLPRFLKRRIHASIRGRVRSTALVFSSLVLGLLVSVFEFACTGQVYLPTLAYLSRLGQTRAILLLAGYNLGFIAPLLVVFAASYTGVTSQRITALFQRHLAVVKIAIALFFLALAVLTLAT